jgi:hypothetical protein
MQEQVNAARPRRAPSERDPFTRVPFLAAAIPDRGRRRALTFAPVPIFTRGGRRVHALTVPMFAVIGAQSHHAGRRRRSNVHDLGFGFQDCHVQTHLIVIVGRALESLPGLPVMLDRGENRVGLRGRECAPRGHEGRERCGHHGPPTDTPRGTRNVTRAIRALVFAWRSPAREAVSETNLPRHWVLTFRFRSHSYLHLVSLQLESGSAPYCSTLDDDVCPHSQYAPELETHPYSAEPRLLDGGLCRRPLRTNRIPYWLANVSGGPPAVGTI